ncbi:hypothetical protein GQ44DRAFT_750370 [Phaeosphaeriaceae sp. PMI808]|nr:hypothetical protein GQ44DRAFT_750370 [Phaeosphaeriaceae sp. PMI808]
MQGFTTKLHKRRSPASSFSLALEEYLNSRPKKSKTPQFIREIQNQQENGAPLDKNAVKQAIIQLERDSTDRAATRRMRKVLNPVVSVLTTYAGVVDTFCQVDPMPTALIWGCLKAAIQCSSRFLELYDKIGDQLSNLNTHIEVLTEYEELFGHSSTMKMLLQDSYIGIIRFWRRVEKECKRCVANRLARAVASFSTIKIDQIVASIDKNAQRITLLIPAIQERLARGEREDVAEERRLAGLARDQQKSFFEMQAEEMRIRNVERKATRKRDLGAWLLGGTSQVNESNHRHQEQHTHSRNPNTCAWLLNEHRFIDWLNTARFSPIIWVKADPGVGKSVLTAYAIEEARRIKPDTTAVCFQYYTFDEEFSPLQVYRALAEQLANRLWEHTEDMPEEIHAVTQRTTTSSRSEDIKVVIRQLLQRMSTTYIFLDGLDEECDKGPRWHSLEQVLRFLVDLAMIEKMPIRIWCSSQARTCIDDILQLYSTLEVTSTLNNKDIEIYIKDQISTLDDLEMDEGYKNLIIAELGQKADGCFLWASLMLHSIADSNSLHAIQLQIDKGLPTDYEKYYLRKLQGIQASDRDLISVVLTCIVYAKRPLRLDELCEASAVIETGYGENIDRNRQLLRKKVAKLCQPLIRIQDTQTNHGLITTCTLVHATVRKFIMKHAENVAEESQRKLTITPDTLARICIKYLMQPRFDTLLIKDGDSFKDKLNEDIDNHHFLPYAAKYWDKHLDVAKEWQIMCNIVRSFVMSEQFFTTLQVQSLFVGGQFKFWWNSLDLDAGPHIKRVFPSWLGANCVETLENDYRLFISDWGYLLDEITTLNSSFSGEIDRCFFGALGPDNFLHSGPSRYTSYQISNGMVSDEGSTARYFDAINEIGTEMIIIIQKEEAGNCAELRFDCQHWDLTDKRPIMKHSQSLNLSTNSTPWSVYNTPAVMKGFGKPPEIALSNDLAVLRIGSMLYTRGHDDLYQPFSNSTHDIAIDEIASHHRYIAFTTRRDRIQPQINDCNAQITKDSTSKQGATAVCQVEYGMPSTGEQAWSSTVPTTVESTDGTRTVAESIPTNSSAESLLIEDMHIESRDKVSEFHISRREAINLEDLAKDEALFMSDSDVAGNSAEEEWSDGSSDMLSDEVEVEDQWNDWGNERLTIEELELEANEMSSPYPESSADDAEVPDFDDLESFTSQTESLSKEEIWNTVDDNEVKISGFTVEKYDLDARSDSRSESDSPASSLESSYSPSNYDDSNEEENSDLDVDTANHLDQLIFGTGSSEGKQRLSLEVHDFTQSNKSLAFHYTSCVTGKIFDSPPVFHPSKSLLVWPLGDSEILFADYKANTFYTRILSCSRFKSCHIFIKAHFSRAGDYIHFAALEAQTVEAKDEGGKGSLALTLQVSTHRISVRKTTRSPPRLVHRNTVALGSVTSLNVSGLPYSLHWTDQNLFLTTRARKLNVVKIPLFSDAKSDNSTVCHIQKEVYLPRTTDSRTLHFFPRAASEFVPSSLCSNFNDHIDENTNMARIIIGSHSPIPNRNILVPAYQISPPIGILLHNEKDLGGWKCLANTSGDDAGQSLNNARGRLQGRFETFDRTEDCDIIPFLV